MGHDNIRIERFNSHHEHYEHLLPKLVSCYQNVFADTPWHEWKRCPQCKRYWGIKDKELLHEMNFSHCGVPLEDYWKTNDVEECIREVFTHNTSCFLALHNEEVIGFCWGYLVDLNELENHLGLGIVAQVEDRWGNSKTAYQSEMGVEAAFRGKKIAKRMFRARHFDFLDMKADVGIVRTRRTPEPSNTYLWFKKLGYETIASYSTTDGRVVLAKKLSEIEDV